MAFAALTVDLNAKLATFEQDMKRATKSLDGLDRKTSAVAAGMKTAFGALATTLSVGALASFAKSGIDAADALNDMSQRTGVAVKTLAEYKLAAQLADTSLDDLAKGIQRLTLSQGQAEQGGKAQAQALKNLGISAKDPKIAFEQLADAVANSNDPTKLAADLNAVLGRSYVNLLPLLQGGAQGLRDSAEASSTFAEQMANLAPNAAKFNDQLDLLKTNAAGAAATILASLVPSINDYAASLSDVLKNGSLLEKVGFFTLGFISEESLNRTQEAGKRVQDYNAQIFKLQQELVHLRDVAGPEASIVKKYESDIARLEKARAGLIVQSRKDAEAASKTTKPGVGALNLSAASTKTGGSKSDPLAGLLGSTDIGKLAAFDKQVALLNTRFDGGRKSTDLYNQAMTKLVESTFAANFSEFNKQLAEQDETQRMVAEHLQATNDEVYAQSQAWAEAGRALEDEMRTPLENANIEFGRLQELLDRGAISWETYTRAVFKASEALEKPVEKIDEMDVFAKKAAENIQQSFADFLFDPFDKGVDGMLKSFGQTIQRMIADAVAADLARPLFGDLVKGGEGSGVFGTVLSGIGELFGFADGGIASHGKPVPMPRFAGGGIANSAAIFGEAGPEAAVPLPDGRRIPVEMRGGSGHTVNVYISGTNNAADVRRAAGQGAREALGLLEGARRYG